MKLKIAIISLFALLFLLSACDRYEHNFSKLPTGDVDDLEEFVQSIDYRFAMLNSDNFSLVEALYAEDYIHNGVSKGERLAWIESFLDVPGVSFEVSDVELNSITYEIGLVNWRLKILTQDTRTVLADSLFVGDQAKYEDGIYLLYGNRVCIQDNPKQLVIAEYFTFDSCPNCPVAEAKLSMMQQTHPNFIYLEHHITNALLVPDNDTPSYYSAYSAPTAVFQGMSKVVGSAAEQLQLYDNLVNNLVNEDQSIEYELQDISYDSNEIRAKVILTASPEMDINDMYLNYVIITDEVSQTNVNGDPLHNVVRAVGRSPLTAWDMQHGVSISLGTSDPMPSNYKLVVFAQYRPQVFINESRIYGGIVHTVSSK